MHEVEYEFWNEYGGQFYTTNLFRCYGITKSGDRCHRYVSSDDMFCKSHKLQGAQLDQECLEFFGIKANNDSGSQKGA